MAEWWKQLFGESEGKEGKGLFPASVEFTADLHSMGQYIQQGRRLMFETVVTLGASEKPAGRCRQDDIRRRRAQLPHRPQIPGRHPRPRHGGHAAGPHGGRVCPTSSSTPTDKSPAAPGAVSSTSSSTPAACPAILLDVNPFDQPGVEAYKKQHVRPAGQARLRGPARRAGGKAGAVNFRLSVLEKIYAVTFRFLLREI
jgi:glucose-6-phosphate isomerase